MRRFILTLAVLFTPALSVNASVALQHFEVTGSKNSPVVQNTKTVSNKTAVAMPNQNLRVISTVNGVTQTGWIVNQKLRINKGVLYITWQPDPDQIFKNGFDLVAATRR